MTRTFWLASYPKSGNTWMRILIANALSSIDVPIDLNKIWIGGIASDRSSFDYVALIDSGLLTHDEIDSLRPRIYAASARSALDAEPDEQNVPHARFIKIHDAYSLNGAGEPLLGGPQGACGAIVIVRDPRDVAPSLAHHMNWSIDRAIAFMNDESAAFCVKTDRQPRQLRQKLWGWSEHVLSWLDQTDVPVHLLRYENLRIHPAGQLCRALRFAGVPAIEQVVNRAVQFSDFAQLQCHEDNRGFAEAPRWNERKRFFRRGEVGAWHDELTPKQVVLIESRHGKAMQRLGYELSGVSSLARTG